VDLLASDVAVRGLGWEAFARPGSCAGSTGGSWCGYERSPSWR